MKKIPSFSIFESASVFKALADQESALYTQISKLMKTLKDKPEKSRLTSNQIELARLKLQQIKLKRKIEMMK